MIMIIIIIAIIIMLHNENDYVPDQAECKGFSATATFILHMGWGLLSQFSPFCSFFYEFFSIVKKNLSIFDRCRRSSAAVSHVRYECNFSNNLKVTFARLKINERCFRNPHPLTAEGMCTSPLIVSHHSATLVTRHSLQLRPLVSRFIDS